MDQNIDRKVKELIALSLDGCDFRVCLVVTLLKEGMFEDALEHSLPLIGTRHTPWFLYARAWHHLAGGSMRDAHRTLAEAYSTLDQQYHDWSPEGFAFTEMGKPRIAAPFNSPLNYFTPEGVRDPGDSETLGYAAAIFQEDWLALLADINRNIREYKLLFEGLAEGVEKVLHHDVETVGAAVAAAEIDDGMDGKGGSFLLLTLMSKKHLRLVSDTLWRVCADWNYPLSLCEITSYFKHLSEEDDVALDLAATGLRQDPASVVCGNVRALVYNRSDRPYLADEQWRDTLRRSPNRSATYLVLGHQALCSGGLDAALRYFHEAVMLGDNLAEANRFLTAALDFGP